MKPVERAALDRAVESTITHQARRIFSQSQRKSARLSRLAGRHPTPSSSGVSVPSLSSSNRDAPPQTLLYSHTSSMPLTPTTPRTSPRRQHSAAPYRHQRYTCHRGSGDQEAANAGRNSSPLRGRNAKNAPDGRHPLSPHRGQDIAPLNHIYSAPPPRSDGRRGRRRRDNDTSADEEDGCRRKRRTERCLHTESDVPLVAGSSDSSQVSSSPPGKFSEVVKSLLPPSSVATCVLTLDAKLIELLYCLSPTSEDREMRLRVINDIRSTVQRVGLDIQVYGSLCTGLMIPASDVDCVLMRSANEKIARSMADTMSWSMASIDSAATGAASQRSLKGALLTALRTVANRMRCSQNFTHITCIAHAKVPIVKCWHRREKVRVDLSFERSGCTSSNYLCKLFCEPGNEMARPLIVLVKALVNNCHLDDPSIGGLGSFPISLLVLWYLQQCVRARFSAELQRSIGALLAGFLKYYGHEFDFRHRGIDYAQQKTFAKAPADDLYIMNPIRPGTNCAKAATLFATRVVPLFQQASATFLGFLHLKASPAAMESPLLRYFSTAASNAQSWRDVSRRAARELHLRQNIWDSEINMYVGGVL
ncbi:hypothetical protein LSCM1_04056 [Leishmania martiniquensis]|uniref:DNA polymerase sigma-like protein n=1 Tax=Leishmania martiniquensis TaxID=1580590 RepID=A0A836GM67_9TRYP|nr:hypothetical protein LSCM1_04056 [Leishmania martiniquensis]